MISKTIIATTGKFLPKPSERDCSFFVVLRSRTLPRKFHKERDHLLCFIIMDLAFIAIFSPRSFFSGKEWSDRDCFYENGTNKEAVLRTVIIFLLR